MTLAAVVAVVDGLRERAKVSAIASQAVEAYDAAAKVSSDARSMADFAREGRRIANGAWINVMSARE